MKDDVQVSDKPFAFGPNPLRLSPLECGLVVLLVLIAWIVLPPLWSRLERYEPGDNYRIANELNNDYWVFSRWAEKAVESHPVLMIGDSAIWGHYVGNQESLTACMNRLEAKETYANLGISGLHSVALYGMVRFHGGAIRNSRVILHVSPLWMTSPRADLSDEKEARFLHPELAKQLLDAPACYRAPLEDRLAIAVRQRSGTLNVLDHVTDSSFDNLAPPQWVVKNPYANPLSRISCAIEAGPNKAEGKAQSWQEKGMSPVDYQWVSVGEGYQWRSFVRAIELVKSRGNSVFVLVGPFNPHIIKAESLPRYRALMSGMASWLAENGIPFWTATELPTELYGDASHPLPRGYEMLAKDLLNDEGFRKWRKGNE